MRAAKLRKAQRSSMFSGGFILRGIIHGDNLGIYRDGTFIYTSRVVEEPSPNFFRTASGSLYEVEEWVAPSKPTAEYENLPADWPVPPQQETQEISTS
jgi:hypothetical protein